MKLLARVLSIAIVLGASATAVVAQTASAPPPPPPPAGIPFDGIVGIALLLGAIYIGYRKFYKRPAVEEAALEQE